MRVLNSCDHQCNKKDWFKEHVLTFHEGVAYYCIKCGKECRITDKLKWHLGSKHYCAKNPCKYCKSKVVQLCYIKKHVKALGQSIRLSMKKSLSMKMKFCC
jgi:hypothetical protein